MATKKMYKRISWLKENTPFFFIFTGSISHLSYVLFITNAFVLFLIIKKNPFLLFLLCKIKGGWISCLEQRFFFWLGFESYLKNVSSGFLPFVFI